MGASSPDLGALSCLRYSEAFFLAYTLPKQLVFLIYCVSCKESTAQKGIFHSDLSKLIPKLLYRPQIGGDVGKTDRGGFIKTRKATEKSLPSVTINYK
jgi:hypothetical protein